MKHLDRALAILGETGPSFGGGLANHGPMVVESLDFLGVSDAIEPWVEWYGRRLEPMGGAGTAYLRNRSRLLDEIDTSGWEATVRRRLPRLVDDGTAGSAGHGLLRVAHAVRALSRADSPARRNELANGLAYWQLTWRRLPGGRPDPKGERSVVEALAALPVPAVATGGFFTTVLPAVAVTPGFADVVNSLRAPADVGAGLSEVTEAAARAYLANSVRNPIALVHAVTIPAAARTLLPYLDSRDCERAFAAAWQAVAAMVAGYGAGLGAHEPSCDEAWAGIIPAVVAARDDHAIKLAGACRAEDGLHPSPVYRAAAADVAIQLAVAEGAL